MNKLMRTFQFAALALTAFGATMTVKAPEANAVVYCAAGVYRAGCVARPVAAPTVKRTARRTVSTPSASPTYGTNGTSTAQMEDAIERFMRATGCSQRQAALALRTHDPHVQCSGGGVDNNSTF